MKSFDEYLEMAATMHRGCVCPGQVLGTRMAMLGCELLGIDPPDQEKRLFVFVEIDRCLADAVAAVSGCRLGKRTLKYIDYGKAAATFYDQRTGRAVRVVARDDSREKVSQYATPDMDKYTAQVHAYRVMPAEDLFVVQEVAVEIAPENRPGRPVSRVTCQRCGEGINDRREVHMDGQILCRACANGAYYRTLEVAGSLQVPLNGRIATPL
ncbi:MAG: formylmethanofuran dehydrogenase [Chloroflexi bacterium]|nr:MAG: formylmethanofuran dehydrogenase [Chloroflexota bacterium]